MTFAERVNAVAALGFRPRQAAFLTTVALHSGYCLRRQYAAFAGCKYGKNVRDFLDGVVEQRLAERITYRANRGSIYHLFGRRLYAAIRQEDNRNRRHASPPLIARKLMFLDFVIAHPAFDWYATESDKVELFVNRLGVPTEILPQRTYEPRTLGTRRTDGTRNTRAPSPSRLLPPTETTRYWIQKLPIFLHGDSPTVHFVTVVTDAHASAIEAFVREHTPLLRHLRDWSLHAVVPRCTASETACAAAYTRALASASLMSIPRTDLEWFASTKPLVASGDLRDLKIEDLKRYRELSRTLSDRFETQTAGPLTLHDLPHSYAQLGSFPGVS
jgi:hypothetical protein